MNPILTNINGDDMKINVIGDVTGFGKTLKSLIKDMPKAELWCLGDIMDRGPNSKLALDFLIDNNHNSVMGNHDHMMLFEKIANDPGVHGRLYPSGCWGWNGGHETAVSFGVQFTHELDTSKMDKYFDFIANMPLKKEVDGLILTHAPISDKKNQRIYDLKEINKDPYLLDISALWNRNDPSKQKDKFQIYGHNSTKGVLWHTQKHPTGIYMADKEEVPADAWGVCIDTWRMGYLTGLHIDTDLLDKPNLAIKVFMKKITDKFDFETPKKKRQKGIYEF